MQYNTIFRSISSEMHTQSYNGKLNCVTSMATSEETCLRTEGPISYTALKKQECFFCPRGWRPKGPWLQWAPLPCLFQGFCRTRVLQLPGLLFPTVSREPQRPGWQKGECGPAAPTSSASVAGLPPGFWGHKAHGPQLSTPAHLCAYRSLLPTVLLTAASQMLKNPTEMLSSSSSMKQTHPTQLLPDCHLGWSHVFIRHQKMRSRDIRSRHGFTKMLLERKQTLIMHWQ